MSRQAYNIIELLRKLKSKDIIPGKKKFQKLVYLVENEGNVKLGFNYEIHFYGPYSSELDNVLVELGGEGLIYYDYQGSSHLICVNELNEDDDFYKTDLTDDELQSIERIFSIFGNRTPNELELLTTAHFAFQKLQDKSTPNIINGVKKIKGEKYTDAEIEQALKEFTNLKS